MGLEAAVEQWLRAEAGCGKLWCGWQGPQAECCAQGRPESVLVLHLHRQQT